MVDRRSAVKPFDYYSVNFLGFFNIYNIHYKNTRNNVDTRIIPHYTVSLLIVLLYCKLNTITITLPELTCVRMSVRVSVI